MVNTIVGVLMLVFVLVSFGIFISVINEADCGNRKLII